MKNGGHGGQPTVGKSANSAVSVDYNTKMATTV